MPLAIALRWTPSWLATKATCGCTTQPAGDDLVQSSYQTQAALLMMLSTAVTKSHSVQR